MWYAPRMKRAINQPYLCYIMLNHATYVPIGDGLGLPSGNLTYRSGKSSSLIAKSSIHGPCSIFFHLSGQIISNDSNSLTWNVRPFWDDSLQSNHDSRVRSQLHAPWSRGRRHCHCCRVDVTRLQRHHLRVTLRMLRNNGGGPWSATQAPSPEVAGLEANGR